MTKPASAAMLTSNGLTLASGVKKCRMRGLLMLERSFAARRCDLCPAVAASDDAKFQFAPFRRMLAQRGNETLRLRCGVRQREPGRSPRGLADAGHVLRTQPSRGAADGGTAVAAILRAREVIAKPVLNFADGRRRRRELRFGNRRKEPHQHEAAEPAGELLVERRQARERLRFGGAVEAAAAAVKNQQYPPGRRERQAGDDRRRRVAAIAPAIDEKAAAREGADADAGTRATAGRTRQRGRAEFAAMEPCQRRR